MDKLDIITENHTYLRVGDIVQSNVNVIHGIEFPIFDVIMDENDPLLRLNNLSGCKVYGNVYNGDSVDGIQQKSDEYIKYIHPEIFSAYGHKKTHEREYNAQLNACLQAAKPQQKNTNKYFLVLSQKIYNAQFGKEVICLFENLNTKETLWVSKYFSYKRGRELQAFLKTTAVKSRVVCGLKKNGRYNNVTWIKNF